MDETDAPLPSWVVWTNRAVLTLAGTTAAVMVADYAAGSGESLDVALVVAIIATSAVAVIRPDHMVAVLAASLLSMLGLAIIPPAWLLSLVPPLLLSTARRRQRGDRWRDRWPGSADGPAAPHDDPDDQNDPDEDPAP